MKNLFKKSAITPEITSPPPSDKEKLRHFLETYRENERVRKSSQIETLEKECIRFESEIIDLFNGVEEDFTETLDIAGQIVEATSNSATSTEQLAQTIHIVKESSDSACQTGQQVSETMAQLEGNLSSHISEIDAIAQVSVQAKEIIEDLAKHLSEINGVVGLIKNIASQTNLLALNATIEAARAGDAGKGFAVVAGEVKQLASQTDNATDQISKLVDTIQSLSDQAVSASATVGTQTQEIRQQMTELTQSTHAQNEATRQIEGVLQDTQHEITSCTDLSDFVQQNSHLASQQAHQGREVSTRTQSKFKEAETHVESFLQLVSHNYRGNREEARRLFDHAVATVKNFGRQQALEIMDDPVNGYIDRDLYVIGLDDTGFFVLDPRRIYPRDKDMRGAKDANGKLFIQEVLANSKNNRINEFSCTIMNPLKGIAEDKRGFLWRTDDLTLLVGYYE